MKWLRFLVLLAPITLGACAVYTPGYYAYRAPGRYWVPGHYGPHGGWHPGRWS